VAPRRWRVVSCGPSAADSGCPGVPSGQLSALGATLVDVENTTSERDLQWLFVDTLASIVGADESEVGAHLVAMDARGSREGQERIMAELWRCEHPQTLDALDLLSCHHPDEAVAREARKAAMRARTRALGVARRTLVSA
jgi:hypothetical protein